MKKLLLKFTIISVFVAGLVLLLEYLSINESTREMTAKLTNSSDFLSEGSGTSDIVPMIESVREDDDTTVLVIGDSIARQMFGAFSEDCPYARIACVNAAINVSGQYMLAAEYLDSHPDATDVWLFAHPLTLTRTYDLELGYGYAVTPFAIEGSLKYLDDITIDQMASVYGRFALNGRFAKLVDDSPMNRKLFFGYIRMNNSEYEQSNDYEITSLYILKLKELCEERGVAFHFYSSPSTEYYREKIEETRFDFEASPLSEVYPDYLDSIYFFPTEWSSDYTHFGGDYANRGTYEEVIENAYPDFFCDIM